MLLCIISGASPFTKFGKFSSTDPDTAQNCLLQYTMPEEAAKKFTVSSNGDFQTKAKLDREFNAQYVFFVTVTDCGSPQLSDSVRVTIIVSDVNDNSPQFPGSYNVDIKESESPGSRVVQVKATGRHSLKLAANFFSCFNLVYLFFSFIKRVET